MKLPLPPPVRNFTVLRLLWKAARTRSTGRKKRARALMRRKKGSGSGFDPGGCLALVFAVIIMSLVHVMLGITLIRVQREVRVQTWEQQGRWMIEQRDESLLDAVVYADRVLEEARKRQELDPGEDNIATLQLCIQSQEGALNTLTRTFVWRHRNRSDGPADPGAISEHYLTFGRAGFISERQVESETPRGGAVLSKPGAAVLAVILLWWFLMVICQGEGLEMDVQRRRHPLWEWLLSHPVRPVAAFAAEMLAPVVANPVYLTAPVFWLVALAGQDGIGFVSALGWSLVIGLPCGVAAACLNKSVEVAALLRLSPRNRGAVLGVMSWIGYAAMMMAFFVTQVRDAGAILRWIEPYTHWFPVWPVQALTSGWGNQPDAWQIALSVWAVCGLILGLAVILSAWGFSQGLQGSSDSGRPGRAVSAGSGSTRWRPGRALYRKELLWFRRDKSAVVQAVLIPLTIGAFQAFNLRHVAESAVGSWNGLCGLGIICATYFLLVLGPRSLASEGQALWLTLTWPQGLESLLKAKARLWWLLSSVLIVIVLAVAVVLYPANWWQVGLVGVGWYFFGRSLAEKSVSLVRAPSSGGEPEPAPRSRQWAAMLGTLAFSSGVITGNWHTAILGVVFSSLTAAAMWQDLRARLPYLYDPWSEKLPPPPTLIHAMVAIAIMVEATGFAMAMGSLASPEQAALVNVISYAILGGLAWGFTSGFLSGRGVKGRDIWEWPAQICRRRHGLVDSLHVSGAALGAGLLLGGVGVVYVYILRAIPAFSGLFAASDAMRAANPKLMIAMFPVAVFLVPFAEEYLFRGLLFRALEREWSGRSAMIGSAAWFAIYHPPVSWLPVFALGLASAWIFGARGRLIACVALHMGYNAVVMGFQA